MKKKKCAKCKRRMGKLIAGGVLVAVCILIALLTRSCGTAEKQEGENTATGAATQSATTDSPAVQPPTETQMQHEDGNTHPTEGTEPVVDFSVPGDLYWNIDRAQYTDSTSRKPDANGVYKIRFAYDGALLEKTVTDKQLVELIDTMDVMALETDDAGVVTNVLPAVDVCAEYAKNVYVKTVSAGTLEITSAADLSGLSTEYVLTGTVGIYDVTPGSQNPGKAMQPGDLKAGDTLQIYGDGDGNVTHIYVTARK